MAKPKGKSDSSSRWVEFISQKAEQTASEMGLELVEASLQKESRGRVLTVYVDKEGGLSLDDCERYHKCLQPLLEEVDYDIMEVSSPGVDRPIRTDRDFRKNRGNTVEIHLFAPLNGSKLYRGALTEMDTLTVTITDTAGEAIVFDRKKVSLIKPVIELDEDDFADVVFDENEAQEMTEEE